MAIESVHVHIRGAMVAFVDIGDKLISVRTSSVLPNYEIALTSFKHNLVFLAFSWITRNFVITCFDFIKTTEVSFLDLG